jgi:predicted transcriptional regulator
MSIPVVLANKPMKVIDAWAAKIVSKQALPDNVVGQNELGTQFIFEEWDGVALFSVVMDDLKVRIATDEEYRAVIEAISEGKFQITELDPNTTVRTVIHEASGEPLAVKRPAPDSAPGL